MKDGVKEFAKEHKAAIAANVAVTGVAMVYDVANNPTTSYLARAAATVATSALVAGVQAAGMYAYNRYMGKAAAPAAVAAEEEVVAAPRRVQPKRAAKKQ
ncbi:MAG: hypothetical protein JSR17_04775 [Proteobacteria bacterium]|nr:hypothetical protein [Pseudomonadota bacterium]